MSLRISVITPVYNCARGIRKCLESVQSQSYPNWEHIVVDGVSTDGTLDVLREDGWKNVVWTSEPDEGIYAAMNKGLRLATGDIWVVLNADDYYFADVFDAVVALFSDSSVQAAFGDIYRDDECSILVKAQKRVLWKEQPILQMPFPHISVFARKELYHRHGYFDERYRLAADFDLVYRWIRQGVLFSYLGRAVGVASMGGATSGLAGALRVNREFSQIACRHGVSRLMAWTNYGWYCLKWLVIGLMPRSIFFWYLRRR